MKSKYTLPPLLAVLLIPAISAADPIAVKEDLSFIAINGSLTIAPLAVGDVPLTVEHELPEGCPKTTPIPIEGDKGIPLGVILDGDYAVVADFNTAKILKTVDISACFHQKDDSDSCDDNATLDLKEGKLFLPCLKVDGKYFSLEMDRRGHSDNWRVNMNTVVAVP